MDDRIELGAVVLAWSWFSLDLIWNDTARYKDREGDLVFGSWRCERRKDGNQALGIRSHIFLFLKDFTILQCFMDSANHLWRLQNIAFGRVCIGSRPDDVSKPFRVLDQLHILSLFPRYWGVWNSVDWSCQPLSHVDSPHAVTKSQSPGFFTSKSDFSGNLDEHFLILSFSGECRGLPWFSLRPIPRFCPGLSGDVQGKNRAMTEVSPCPLSPWSSGGSDLGSSTLCGTPLGSGAPGCGSMNNLEDRFINQRHWSI